MQSSLLALAALSAVATAQMTYPVLVGMNKTLTFSPDNVVAPVGSFVQFQFMGGNHTASQSNFDDPCQPIGMFGNVTGFHSGFQPVAASVAQGQGPVFTIEITNSKPIWVYCSQAKHCESGMSMVINENTTANASRSLANYKTAASSIAGTVIPGNVTTGGNGDSTANPSQTTGGGGAAGATTKTGDAAALGLSSAVGLLGFVAALFLIS